MNNVLVSLLGGLVGAVGAFLAAIWYGRVQLRAIQHQIQIALKQKHRDELIEMLSALTAIRSEIEHNQKLASQSYEHYLPLALSDHLWHAHVGRLHGIEPRYIHILTGAYLLISEIRACHASVGASEPGSAKSESLWGNLREELRVALNVVEGEMYRMQPALAALDQSLVAPHGSADKGLA